MKENPPIDQDSKEGLEEHSPDKTARNSLPEFKGNLIKTVTVEKREVPSADKVSPAKTVESPKKFPNPRGRPPKHSRKTLENSKEGSEKNSASIVEVTKKIQNTKTNANANSPAKIDGNLKNIPDSVPVKDPQTSSLTVSFYEFFCWRIRSDNVTTMYHS